MKRKQYAVLAVCAAAAGAFLVFSPVASKAGSGQAFKLEGAWIATADNGIRGLVTFGPSDPSGRSAAFRNQMVWPPELLAGAGIEAVTDEIGENVITGPHSSTYTAIWYGLVGGRVVTIFLDHTVVNQVSPNLLDLAHTLDVYLATTDADNDGYPDEGSAPMQTQAAHSTSKRLVQ